MCTVKMHMQFEQVSSTLAYDTLPTTKYVSQRTGLSVVICDVESFYVGGTFIVPAENKKNDGCISALNHLIYNGRSEKYPFRGMLNEPKNKVVIGSSITHSSFTFSMLGPEAALAMLDICADNILNPLLTEEDFIYNIHNVNGDGDDDDYYDMLKRDAITSGYKRCGVRLMKELYANNGFQHYYDFDGTGESMRNLTFAEVKEMHKKYYRLENMTVLLCGQLDHQMVLKTLSNIEDGVLAKWAIEPPKKFVKPWRNLPKPKFGKHHEMYSVDRDALGNIFVGWHGPVINSFTANKEIKACGAIMSSLCSGDTGILRERLVNDKCIAENITSHIEDFAIPTLLCIEIYGIPVKKLIQAKFETIDVFKKIYKGDVSLDIAQIHNNILKSLIHLREDLESDLKTEMFVRVLQDAMKYGTGWEFDCIVNPQRDLNELLLEPPEYWLDVFKKYFTNDAVIVVGTPIIEYHFLTRLEEEERKRVELQKLKLGKDGLEEKAKLLTTASDAYWRPEARKSLRALSLIPLPSHIPRLYNSTTWSSDSEPCPHFNLKELPFYARVHSLHTTYTNISIILDTADVGPVSRKWIPFLLSNLGCFSIKRSGVILPCLGKKLEMINQTTEVGFTDGQVKVFTNYIQVSAQIFTEGYEEAVQILYDVLFNAHITRDELQRCAMNSPNRLPEDPNPYSTQIFLLDNLYREKNNTYWEFLHKQGRLIKDILIRLNGDTMVDTLVEEIQCAYVDMKKRMWLYLAADFEKYNLRTECWKKFGHESAGPIVSPSPRWDPSHRYKKSQRIIFGLKYLEISFLMLVGPGLSTMDPEVVGPAILATYYFKKKWLDPMKYHLEFGFSLVEGRLMLSIFNLDNAPLAYQKLQNVMKKHLESYTYDTAKFKRAKLEAIRDIVKEIPTDVVESSLADFFWGVGDNYNSALVKAIVETTPFRMRKEVERFSSLFDAEQSHLYVLCVPNEVIQVHNDFKKMGVELEVVLTNNFMKYTSH